MSLRDRYFDGLVSRVEADSRQAVADGESSASTRRVAVVLLTATIALTAIRFGQNGTTPDWLADWSTPEFARLARWATVNIAGYLLIPWIAIRFLLGLRIRDFGLTTRGLATTWQPYAVLLALSVPFVVLASYSDAFQSKYPFYDLSVGESLWPWMALWWVLYLLQFLGVEFFFRGFMTLGLAPRFGTGAVFAMVVPYVMIHFTKPALEAVAAIVGGTVLGFLALKTRSVWWGVAVHVSIALLMDFLALWHVGLP